MDIGQILLLGLVQGLTEFLPVSSSAHLILFGHFTEFGDQGLLFDVAAHLGSLIAVIIYFRRELSAMVTGQAIAGLQFSGSSRQLIFWLGLASVPLGIVGLLSADFVSSNLRQPLVIAWATIGFGLLLGLADWLHRRQAKANAPTAKLTLPRALSIGLAQALALIPGTSRAGITITAALMLGMSYQAAARFSFLLAIPAITAAGIFGLSEMLATNSELAWTDFGLGVLASAIGASLCIHWFLKLVDRLGMLPFVVYRILLGVVLLLLLL